MKFKLLALGAAFALAASTAFAQEAAPIALTLTPTSANTLGTTFQSTVTGFFLDTFEFTPASLGGGGTVSVSLMPLSGPVNFAAALLNGEGFGFMPESGATTFAFAASITPGAPLELQVLGFAGDAEAFEGDTATYSSMITVQTVAAIPEPETYALMLAGLGVVGAIARRRRRRSAATLRT